MDKVSRFFPNGKIQGDYIVCGDIYGNSGKSFKYNMANDLWADFSTGESGKGIENLLRLRGEVFAFPPKSFYSQTIKPISKVQKNKEALLPTDRPCKNPEIEFRMSPRPGGKFSKYWEYKNQSGKYCFYVVRYDYKDGKETIPYSFDGSKWIPKAWPNYRPPYNVDKLKNYNKIMITEGEKCADAVKLAFPEYLGMCWQGGCKATKKTDWALIKGKEIVIFPDNDKAGYEAAKEVARELNRHNKVRVLALYKLDLDHGYDLADMIEDKWEFKQLKERYRL